MVAVDVSTRAPAVDPASASRMSANGRAEGGEGGFGSALDSLDQGGRRAGRKGEDENAASPSPGETAGEENGAEKSRLDLSAATLARSRLPAGSSETAAQKMRTTIDADKTLADAGEQPADTAGDTLVSAKAGQVTKSLKDLAKTSKDDAGKPAEGDEKTTEAAASTDELSSMLTLLAGSGASGEAPAARLAGMSAKGGRQGEEGRSERTAATNDKANPLSALATADGEPLVMPGGDGATDAQPDERTFRFTSARGKGASMDMIVGTARDGTASFETKAASTGGAETITVLDSRRFLGFGQSINGAALTAAMSGDPEWTSAMQPGSALSNAASQSSTGNVVNTLKLQMTPIDLGTVTATLKLVGDTLNVQLTVENRAAHKQLTQDTSGILEALRAQGFSVDQVSVNIAPAASADPSAQQGDLGQQAAGSGAGRDGSAGRDQQATQSGLPGATSGMIENDPQTDTGAHGARPDLLYV
jgi:chemotaxis protein MotD